MKPLIVLLSLSVLAGSAGCTAAPGVPPAGATASLPAAVATEASGAATRVGSVTVPPALATAAASVSPPPVTAHPLTPLPASLATTVITTFAEYQLKRPVEVMQAIGAAGELELPETTQAEVRAALELAGTSYAALLRGGIGLVALGGGGVSGDLNAALDWGSLGVFTLRSEQPMPSNEAAALVLIEETYPGLARYELTRRGVDSGYAFGAATTIGATDPASGQSAEVGRVVIAGVQESAQGLVFVYAIVATGALAEPLGTP
jgi:hypothetical protein